MSPDDDSDDVSTTPCSESELLDQLSAVIRDQISCTVLRIADGRGMSRGVIACPRCGDELSFKVDNNDMVTAACERVGCFRFRHPLSNIEGNADV